MLADARTVFRESFWAGLRPDPILTVSEWADRYRILSSKGSAEPGPYRTGRVPYAREIMDSLSVTDPCDMVVVMKGAQLGFALPLDTQIPTPAGWKTMGELQVGDAVFDETGAVCRVTFATEVMRDHRCMAVEFDDGSTIVCDENHLWTVDRHNAKGRFVETVTLPASEIERTYKTGYGAKSRNAYAIPVAGPLELPARQLPIPPYVLGLFLGDGSRCTGQITMEMADAKEAAHHIAMNGMRAFVRAGDTRAPHVATILIEPRLKRTRFCERGHDMAVVGKVKGRCGKCHSQQVMHSRNGRQKDAVKYSHETFHGMLGAAGLLKSDKRIPADYLRASVAQRSELLRGLMDTDGHCRNDGLCQFYTCERQLADDVSELLSSLGFKWRMRVKKPTGKPSQLKSGHKITSRQDVYEVSFIAYSDTPVFNLERKRSRQRARDGSRVTETTRRRIVGVSPAESVPVRCITVDSPSHLYLCGRQMIPTHNTEIGHNWLGYVIDNVPGPMLIVQPTTEMSDRNVRQKIDPMLETCPTLAAKVPAKRSRDGGNNLKNKEFPNGFVIFGSANSSASLRSSSVRYLMLDEVDEYEIDLGEQGDPIGLAKARTRAFGSKKKIYVPSTPTVEGKSRIAALFERSDQRYFYVPCPHCQHRQVLKFEQLRWQKNDKGEHLPDTVAYYCQECGGEIPEHHKTWMLENGEWIPHEPGRKVRGYHISALYSPLGMLSWVEIAEMWLEAQENPAKLKEFFNTVLGETWKEKGEAPEWRRLYDRREHYPMGAIPAGGLVLVAGADVQKDRIEVEVVAYGRNMESWSVDYRVLPGGTDTPDGEAWQALDRLLGETYEHAAGAQVPIRMMGVDSGYNTNTVYAWARKYPGRVIATDGQESLSVLVGIPKARDIKTSGKRVTRGVKSWPVGVDLAKTELYGWLRNDPPTGENSADYPFGYCHFPQYSEEYFRQLTAEQKVVKLIRGYRRYQWEKTRERNEALDCRVYARAASFVVGIDRWKDPQWEALEAELNISNGDGGAKPAKVSLAKLVSKQAGKARTNTADDPYL